jgi:hypothetical protein
VLVGYPRDESGVRRSTIIDPGHKRETYFVGEYDASDALWIPEQLVHIIVANDAIMITFPSHKLAIKRLVALITNEAIKRFDNRAKVEAFRYGIDAILALGGAVVIIRTFKDKAEALGNKSNLSGLSPAEKIEGDLTHAVILGHIVHRLAPAFKGTSQRFLRMASAAATFRAKALKTGVLGMTNGVIEIQLGGKVPLAIICVLAPDIIRVEGEECLIGGHAGCTAVK